MTPAGTVPRHAATPFTTGTVAGCVGGIVDILATIAMQASMGISPVRVLQAIASGAVGKAAYTGGFSSAVGGLALHFTLSILSGIAFALVATRLPSVRQRPYLSGPLFGVLFYVLMRHIVLPLSPVAFPLSSNVAVVATSLFFHAFFYGLPIALTVRALTRGRA